MKIKGISTTEKAGDYLVAAVAVGGYAKVTTCLLGNVCRYELCIPETRKDDFDFIVKERAAM